MFIKHGKHRSFLQSSVVKKKRSQMRYLSQSTAPQQPNNIEQGNYLQGQIKKVSQFKPYSLQGKNLIEERLHQRFSLQKKEDQRQGRSKLKIMEESQWFSCSPKSKLSVKSLKDQCKMIITQHVRAGNNKGKQIALQNRSQTVQQNYQDNEQQIANQLITEAGREKKQFRKTMGKFNNLLDKAVQSYINHKNINYNPHKVKGFGLKGLKQKSNVCNRYQDEVFEYQRHSHSPKKYEVNKDDVYTFLKSTNKVINVSKNQSQLRKFNESLKVKQMMSHTNRKKFSSKRVNDLIYKRYFRSSKERKQFLQSYVHLLED